MTYLVVTCHRGARRYFYRNFNSVLAWAFEWLIERAPMADTAQRITRKRGGRLKNAGRPKSAIPAFKYKEMKDAPVSHLRTAWLTVGGMTEEEIAGVIQQNTSQVRLIKQHPPVAEYIDKMRFEAEAARVETGSRLKDLQSLALYALRDRIADPAKLAKIATKDLVKIFEAMSDRHPDGLFVKTTRRKEEHQISVYDTARIEEVKARGYLLGQQGIGQGDPGRAKTEIVDAEIEDVEVIEANSFSGEPSQPAADESPETGAALDIGGVEDAAPNPPLSPDEEQAPCSGT